MQGSNDGDDATVGNEDDRMTERHRAIIRKAEYHCGAFDVPVLTAHELIALREKDDAKVIVVDVRTKARGGRLGCAAHYHQRQHNRQWRRRQHIPAGTHGPRAEIRHRPRVRATQTVRCVAWWHTAESQHEPTHCQVASRH